jgi:hypothetical protein
MNTLLICLAATTLGSDVGWERLDDGGMEYIIQLDPQTLEALKAGSAIQSDIPPAAGNDIRSYRILVGKGKLRRDAPLAKPAAVKNTNPETLVAEESPPPQKLAPNPAQKPMPGQQAVYEESANKPSSPATTVPAEPSKPWLLMTLAFFTSIGANLYLGWVAWEARRRCRTVHAGPLALGM